MKFAYRVLFFIFLSASISYAQDIKLKGTGAPIKSICIERRYLSRQDGKLIEGEAHKESYSQFNRKGNLQQRVQYQPDGSPGNKDEYLYDASEGLSEIRSYGLKGQLLSTEIYRYSNTQNQAEVTSYADGSIDEDSITSKLLFTFDGQGNVQTVEWLLDEDVPYIQQKYLYDSQGNNIETIYQLRPESPAIRIVREFDDKGNVTQKFSYGGIGAFRFQDKFTYEFDGWGNWVKQTRWYNDGEGKFEPSEITYRTITYY